MEHGYDKGSPLHNGGGEDLAMEDYTVYDANGLEVPEGDWPTLRNDPECKCGCLREV